MPHFRRTGIPHTGILRPGAACLGFALALGVWAGAASPSAVAQEGTRAGTAAAIKGSVRQISFQTPKAQVGRVVSSGDPIFLGDRINTGNRARLQILLADRSSFTIGPGASMVIDEFVYDPKTSKGKITARIVKGAFRFVSGKISANNKDAVKLKLPNASIGIRGTIVLGIADGTRSLVMLEGVGRENNLLDAPSSITVTAGGQTITIYRTGWGVVIEGPSKPGPQIRFDQAAIQRILQFLTANLSADRGAVPPPFEVQPPRGPNEELVDLLALIRDVEALLNRPPEVSPPAPSSSSPSVPPCCSTGL